MQAALQGVYPPITTPFKPEGGVWLDKLSANLDRWNQTGLAGYVVLGSNGEACLLEEEEKCEVIRTARKRIPAGKQLIVGVGLEATEATAGFASKAADLGADYLLVSTPHYYKNRMTDDALFAYFSRVADASPVPVLLYSVPDFTGLPLTAGLVTRLAGHPNIAGMKYSTRDMSLLGEIIRQANHGFRVLIGTATVLLPAVALGACGAVVAVACPLPELTVRVFEAAREGASQSARALQNLLAGPAVAVTSRFGIAGLKAAMDLRGYFGGQPRLPLLPLNKAERAALEEVFQAVSD